MATQFNIYYTATLTSYGIITKNFQLFTEKIKDLSGNIIDVAKNIRKDAEESRTLFRSIYNDIPE